MAAPDEYFCKVNLNFVILFHWINLEEILHQVRHTIYEGRVQRENSREKKKEHNSNYSSNNELLMEHFFYLFSIMVKMSP